MQGNAQQIDLFDGTTLLIEAASMIGNTIKDNAKYVITITPDTLTMY